MSKTPRRRRSPAPRRNEVIGGGFFVFRRGKQTGRVSVATSLPYEHGSFEQALAEATRLAKLCPGETYEVFQTSGAIATSNQGLLFAELREAGASVENVASEVSEVKEAA
ncbi:hypothetical protein [Brucella rhizosphaerae]|uniref:Uncharacterized protein n=1 Tax=Brucella rhizosphaerae TaxID=571254 RepID=A0A256FKW5_9HYPH|nr:hypothetical protein [Brucella rhizosphaerae]OYR15487.1 hypothetical protein CEV32_4762 [Brucella rhizosphaerae]